MKPGLAAAVLLGLAAAPALASGALAAENAPPVGMPWAVSAPAIPVPQGTAPGDRALPADLDLRTELGLAALSDCALRHNGVVQPRVAATSAGSGVVGWDGDTDRHRDLIAPRES